MVNLDVGQNASAYEVLGTPLFNVDCIDVNSSVLKCKNFNFI